MIRRPSRPVSGLALLLVAAIAVRCADTFTAYRWTT